MTIFKYTAYAILFLGYLIFSHSCANPGVGPGGGPRDSIPPVILSSTPEPFELNFSGKEIQLNFDEYVVADKLNNLLVVSPPLAEKLNIRTKGKSIVIKLDEDLIPDRTYSVDFKDGVQDFNEGNPIEQLRMLFSTGDQIDTLRISGFLLDAFNLEPIQDALVTLYSVNEDSLFTSLKPDFIAKTNEEGNFLFDNLPPGEFKLYGLKDENKDLYYSSETEAIAFINNMLRPSANYVHQIDTIFDNSDTLISKGYTNYEPDSILAFLFTHEKPEQYIVNFERKERDLFALEFNEMLSDSFSFQLLGYEKNQESIYHEIDEERKKISVWITDTLITNVDTLSYQVNYTVLDTLDLPATRTDTINFIFRKKESKTKGKEDQKEDDKKNDNTFAFTSNLKTNNFDVFEEIIVSAPRPVFAPADTLFKLEKALNDSVTEPVPFEILFKDSSQREIIIKHKLSPETKYTLAIDSATVFSKNGMHNLAYRENFKTQAEDYYGVLHVGLQNLKEPAVLQLLRSNQTEDLVESYPLDSGKTELSMTYLKPGDYKLKIFKDRNMNGVWDTGDYSKNLQPEEVHYFPKVITVKSNWELKEEWIIPEHPKMKKIESEKKETEEDY